MAPAGRPRTAKHRDLPPGLLRRERGGSVRYYYQQPGGKQLPMGGDFDAALEKWKEIHRPASAIAKGSFEHVAQQFEKHGFLGLKPKTQREYSASLGRLKKAFTGRAMKDIRPLHVGQMLHAGRETPYLANRDKATLSRMWNWARSRGLTDLPNPCIGVDGHHEPGRSVIVTDAMYWPIYDRADQVLRDWMRLDIVIGQRVTDITTIRRTDAVKDAAGARALRYRSGKTGTLGLMSIEGDLATLIDELLERKRSAVGIWLLQTDAGQRVTYAMLRKRFDAARAQAIKELGQDFEPWRMQDLRKTSLNQAKTLEEARRRALHTDPRTTAHHYEVRIDSTPGTLPARTDENADGLNQAVITDKAGNNY